MLFNFLKICVKSMFNFGHRLTVFVHFKNLLILMQLITIKIGLKYLMAFFDIP